MNGKGKTQMSTNSADNNPLSRLSHLVKWDNFEPDCENYNMLFTTVQSNSFKLLIEALKDIHNDVQLTIDRDRIEILTLDATNVCLTHLRLDADKFEIFYCRHKLTIGLNLKHFYHLLKTIGNNDVLTCFVERKNDWKLHVVIDNDDKNMKDESKLKLLDVDQNIFQVPPVEFNSVISIRSQDFQKMCKDLERISKELNIRCEGKELTLTVRGDIGEKQITLRENHVNELLFTQSSELVVEDTYNMDYIVMFIKGSNLSTNLEIFMAQNTPLF
jgi:proliferating cell nuclear antigen